MGCKFVINDSLEGSRLDKALVVLCPELSRTKVQLLINSGHVLVNNAEPKSNYLLQLDDQILLEMPEASPSHLEPEEIPLDIRYEDEYLLVINKPRGMVVHPGAGNKEGTLVNALLSYCSEGLSSVGGVCRPGIVHRIDKDTSGLLIIAKDDATHARLSEQLKNREIKRVYAALVHGIIPHKKGSIDAPIGRDPNDRQKMAVVESGKHAVTHFEVKRRFNDATQIECRLETGRTHQIRVHMQYIGFEIIGDPTYCKKSPDMLPIKGQALHSQELGFIHPISGENLSITAELPEDMRKLITLLNS